jgi:poly-gamma-glutamate synthesis protein (capsule biosynthesis protein)
MAAAPLPSTRAAAAALVDAGAALVAGHSAHVFQGVEPPTLYDLGDFVDDYRTDPHLRNDLGLLFIVSLGRRGPEALEALPLKLSYRRTGLATGEEAEWVRRRFVAACRALGTEVEQRDGRLTVRLAEPVRAPPRSRTDRPESRP